MEYLLKVSGLIVVFYLIYIFLLQKVTFFKLNRSFLLLGLGISFVLPLCVIPVYHEYTSQILPLEDLGNYEEITTLPITNTEKPLNIWEYLPFVYGAGVLCFLGLFLFKLITLMKVMSIKKNYKEEDYTFIETDKDISPFSFFKWIVYNPSQFNQTELTQIIAHEKVHAKQYHSIDILLMELCGVFLWFHPIVWLYNKSVKQNLEFLADTSAVNQFKNRKSYQYTLLKVSLPLEQMALTNHFYNSLIKKRIAMLQKSKSKKVNLLKYALVLPVLALFLMGFNKEDVYVEKFNNELSVNNNEFIIYNSFTEYDFDELRKSIEEQGFVLEIKEIKRNDENLITSITLGVYKNELYETFSVGTSSPLKAIHVEYKDEHININYLDFVNYEKRINEQDVLEIIIDKNITIDYLNSIKKSFEQELGMEFNYEVIETNSDHKISKLKYEVKREGHGSVANEQYVDKNREVIKYDGKTHTFSSSTISPKGSVNYGTIYTFDRKISWIIRNNFTDKTLKDWEQRLFQEHGITTKLKNIERNSIGEIKSIDISVQSKSGDIKILKLKEKDKGINDVKLSFNGKGTILGLSEVKEKILYNTVSKDSVKIIQQKREEKKSENKVSKSYPDIKVISYDNGGEKNESLGINRHKINVDPNDLKSIKNPLYIIDGKEVSNEEYNNLNTENIYSVSVLKDKTATDEYGEKGNNGVVKILTKNNNNDSITEPIKMKPLGDLRSDAAIENYYKKSPKNNIFTNRKEFLSISNKKPLIFIDGKESISEDLEKINTENIYSVSVLKDKTATDKYGDKGRNGVIEIIRKENLKAQLEKSILKVNADRNTRQKRIEIQKIKREEAVIKRAELKLRREEQKIKREEQREKRELVRAKREKKNEFKMVLDKNTSDKKLEQYKKNYHTIFDKELKYKIKRNSQNEIIYFDIDFKKIGSVKKAEDENEPIKTSIYTINKNTKVLNVVTYN